MHEIATSKKVVAVIVTYNRCNLLLEALNSLINQRRPPQKIIIVNNASTDETEDLLRVNGWTNHSDILLISLPINMGGAGGFNIGLRKAYELGAEWIWIMDDDCIPEKECLSNLLIAADLIESSISDQIGFLASRVLWTDGSPCLMNLPTPHQLWIGLHQNYPFLSRLSASSFVSMLVSKNSIEKVGLPIKEFFIWFDDYEFSRRISDEMPCYLVTNSVAVHKTENNIAALDFTKLTKSNLWKFSYGVRNEASFHFEKNGFAAGSIFCLRTFFRIFRSVSNWYFRVKILKACWQGFRFRHTRYIEKIDTSKVEHVSNQ